MTSHERHPLLVADVNVVRGQVQIKVNALWHSIHWPCSNPNVLYWPIMRVIAVPSCAYSTE